MVITEHDNKLDPLLPGSLAGRHVRAESGGMIVYGPDVKITIEHPEVYIFSASKGDLSELTSVMCGDSSDGYDACIKINDPQLLAHRLLHRARIPALQNARVSDMFSHAQCQDVGYGVLSRGPELGRSPEASPFLKDMYFAGQREIRIVLWPSQNISNSTLIVRVRRPDQLFEAVFRNLDAKDGNRTTSQSST
jgi:hypothetical protein